MSSQTISQSFARGKVISLEDGIVHFVPAGTNYELHLVLPNEKKDPPLNVPIDAIIRVEARKVYTVPSGGNWVEPIFGKPRTIQGRVRSADDGQIVVQAGANFVVRLPQSDAAVDLNNGPITVGSLVNVAALPGATVEIE